MRLRHILCLRGSLKTDTPVCKNSPTRYNVEEAAEKTGAEHWKMCWIYCSEWFFLQIQKVRDIEERKVGVVCLDDCGGFYAVIPTSVEILKHLNRIRKPWVVFNLLRSGLKLRALWRTAGRRRKQRRRQADQRCLEDIWPHSVGRDLSAVYVLWCGVRSTSTSSQMELKWQKIYSEIRIQAHLNLIVEHSVSNLWL